MAALGEAARAQRPSAALAAPCHGVRPARQTILKRARAALQVVSRVLATQRAQLALASEHQQPPPQPADGPAPRRRVTGKRPDPSRRQALHSAAGAAHLATRSAAAGVPFKHCRDPAAGDGGESPRGGDTGGYGSLLGASREPPGSEDCSAASGMATSFGKNPRGAGAGGRGLEDTSPFAEEPGEESDDGEEECERPHWQPFRQFTGCASSGEALRLFRGLVPELRRHEVQASAMALLCATGADRGRAAQPGQRAEMVDWAVRVHQSSGLRGGTLFLAVRIVDRFCAAARLPLKRPLLLAAAALLIATKFEEETYPAISELVRAGRNTFGEKEVEQVELAVLRRLDFRLHEPTAAHYLPGHELPLPRRRRAGGGGCGCPSTCAGCPHCLYRPLLRYLLELGLACPASGRWMPSLHAAAAARLAAELLRMPEAPGHDRSPFAEEPSAARAQALQGILRQLREALSSADVGRTIHQKHLMCTELRTTTPQVGTVLVVMTEFVADYYRWGSGRLAAGMHGRVAKVLPDGSGLVDFGGDTYHIFPDHLPNLRAMVFRKLACALRKLGVLAREVGEFI